MTDDPNPLVLDFVEWVAARPRRYADVMDAWRTSCPRLTIWEDAIDQGLVQRCRLDGELAIEATEAGHDLLARTRKSDAPLQAVDYRATPSGMAASSTSVER